MAERYCAYCRCYREDDGFKLVQHHASGTLRSMCSRCQAIRKKPRGELQRLADEERLARRGGPK